MLPTKMTFWSTRALAHSCEDRTITAAELSRLRYEHLNLAIYRVAKAIKEVVLAFFDGVQTGILTIPSGMLIVDLFQCIAGNWAVSPGLFEAMIKGLVSDPRKFIIGTVAVITIAGVLGGAREAFQAASVELTEVWKHVRWVWSPEAEAIKAFQECPATNSEKVANVALEPLHWIKRITRGCLAPVRHVWRHLASPETNTSSA